MGAKMERIILGFKTRSKKEINMSHNTSNGEGAIFGFISILVSTMFKWIDVHGVFNAILYSFLGAVVGYCTTLFIKCIHNKIKEFLK
jgi:hypothetical protein